MKKTYSILLLFILSLTYSCVEEFNAGTIEFEDAIVIEATITNEFKHHQILLSRTYRLEEREPNLESDAIVRVITSTNNTYTFNETEPGVYLSDIPFSALPNIRYQLFIDTNDGREYTSKSTELTNNSIIDNLYAIRETNEEGVDGIGIYLDGSAPANNSKYYGYEFEETYQVLAPFWVPDQLVPNPLYPDIEPDDPWVTIPKTIEDGICFSTVNSQGKLVVNTNLLSEDKISKFLIRFIPKDDLRINSRYSILVKQYTQSERSYNYLETLNDLSTSESLLSQNQPGFIAGNIFSPSNPNEKVLGFFEVSSITEERIFFNRSEFFDQKTEAYPWKCEFGLNGFSISYLLRTKKGIHFWGGNDPTQPTLFVFPRECGDCTTLGSNIRPRFWID
tara:strand:+ start:14560 stop:15735 length:1176 start_codon:yes stop_codon:yes gene_type:complete